MIRDQIHLFPNHTRYCKLWPFNSTPSAQPTLVDAAQSVSFTAVANGGSGGYTYSWLGLPSGCTSSNANTIICTPTTAGAYTVSVNLTDSNGFNTASGPLTFAVHSDPTVTSFSSNSTSLSQSQGLSFTVTVNGGTGPFSYSYSGLPPGCSSTNTAHLLLHSLKRRQVQGRSNCYGRSRQVLDDLPQHNGLRDPAVFSNPSGRTDWWAAVAAAAAAVIAGILIMSRRRKSKAKTA